MAVLVHPSLLPALVAKVVSCLGHIKIKSSNQIEAAHLGRKTVDRGLWTMDHMPPTDLPSDV